MTTAHHTPQRYQTLPLPPALDNQRPRLPLPSHLDPPFTPHAPQARPLFSDIPGRNQASYPGQANSQGGAPPLETSWSAQTFQRGASQGSVVSLPPLYPPDVAFQSRGPATSYEPLSPGEHASHGPVRRSSLFDDSTYSSRPYSSTSQPRHSPASSHQSSTTSSSGQRSRAPYDSRLPALSGESVSNTEGKEKEQDRFVSWLVCARN